MVLWNLLLSHLLRLNTLRDIRYQIHFFTLKRYIEHIGSFIWESSQGGGRLNATQVANYFNISSSYPVTLLFFQLDVCMCWHLQDNLVEPPNELQECLQNREEIYIIIYIHWCTGLWIEWSNQALAEVIVLCFGEDTILQQCEYLTGILVRGQVCTVRSFGRGVLLGHWNPFE